MRLAIGVLVRLFLPLINGMAKGWQGLRGIKIIKSSEDYHANRGVLTNLFAFAANSVSMGLSSVQGKRPKSAVPLDSNCFKCCVISL